MLVHKSLILILYQPLLVYPPYCIGQLVEGELQHTHGERERGRGGREGERGGREREYKNGLYNVILDCSIFL